MSNVPNYAPGPNPSDAVKGPAMFLLVVGGLIVLGNILGLVLNVLGVGMGAIGGRDGMQQMFSGGIGIALNFLNMGLGVVVALGALKMQKLQSYGFSMAAAIIAMLPCSCCCLLGLPAGIWALIVLMKPEVKAAFNQGGSFPTT